MRIASTLINSAYPQKTAVNDKKEAEKKGVPKNPETKVASEEKSIDKIDLRAGLSLERIQSLLTTEVGKRVEKMMAAAGIDITAAAGLDWSPEATAGRIFDWTTGLFGIWREQHPKMGEEELIDSFENVIRGSVDQGAQEAIALIEGSELGSDATSVAEETMTTLHSRYDDFFAGLRASLVEDTASEDPAE